MNEPQRHLRGPLETIEWVSGAEMPDNAAVDGTVLILHGFGAAGDDLVSLAPALAGVRRTRFVFPAAPLSPPDMRGWGGRAWWAMRLAEVLAELAGGRFESLFYAAPPGLDDARTALRRCLDAVSEVAGDGPLTLGGFSQGAMLAADAVMNGGAAGPVEAAGLLLFSGAPIDSAAWTVEPPTAFVSHGRSDEVLPLACGEALQNRLEAAGGDVTFAPFAEGHTIPQTIVRDAAAWLRTRQLA